MSSNATSINRSLQLRLKRVRIVSRYNKQAEADAIENGRVDKQGKPIYARRPTTARPATPAIIPVKKSCWWDGVRSGRFPKPVKLGRCTMWRVEEIRTLIASA
jgi:hypothetical protein